jgi:hypothetical protein
MIRMSRAMLPVALILTCAAAELQAAWPHARSRLTLGRWLGWGYSDGYHAAQPLPHHAPSPTYPGTVVTFPDDVGAVRWRPVPTPLAPPPAEPLPGTAPDPGEPSR